MTRITTTMSGIDTTQDWEPWDYDNPESRLVLPLKSLPIGRSMTLARGVVVKVVAVPHGAHSVRRYHIGGGGSRQVNQEQQRHGSTVKSATEAAHAAVAMSKQLGRPSQEEAA